MLSFGRRKTISNLTVAKKQSCWRYFGQKTHFARGRCCANLQRKKTTLVKINGIGEYALKHLFDSSNVLKAKQELDYIQENNIQYSYF